MIFESTVLSATFFGLVSAATLPLGAAIGLVWRPPDRILAILLAFGGGALLAALTIDLIAPGVDRGHFQELAVGAIVGGFLFKLLDWLVNRKGGYLRKPSTAMTYWRKEARTRLKRILSEIRRTNILSDLSADAEERLLSIMLVRDFPAGSSIYRADDPATNVYIVYEGEVQLTDPLRNGEVFEILKKNAIFGRMSFRTGLRRATEAHTVKDTKLLIIPRESFLDLLEDSVELREVAANGIEEDEVTRYLVERHGFSKAQALEWQAEAKSSVLANGRYNPPIPDTPPPTNFTALLRGGSRSDFFSGLSEETLERAASCFIHKSNPRGYSFFHLGQPAERLYLLRKGTVFLFDPDDRSRKPIVVESGAFFGALSFFTEGTHAVTAIGNEDTEVSVLRRRDFDILLEEVPELRVHLSQYLRESRFVNYLTEQHNLDAQKAASWINKAAKSIEGGRVFPSLAEVTQKVASHSGAAMAMFLGIMLDGIPESFVIGANVLVTGGISLSLLGGLFLANFPEALSSAAGMKEQGMSRARILTMWTGLMLITGIGAGLGATLLQGAPDTIFALIEGVAAGAMLTMVAETMLPEAFHKGGGVVGISTLSGFLAAVFFNTLG